MNNNIYALYCIRIGRRALTIVTLSLLNVLAAPAANAQLVLSELMYNPVGGSTNEFVELHNAGDSAVDVGGWRFSAGITYTFPLPSVIEAKGYLVVAVNRPAFLALYPAVTNLAAGAYTGQLSNQGEAVTLADAGGALVFTVTYNTKAPWPLAADGLGSSLVLSDPAAPAADPASWVASAQLNGSPGGPDTAFLQDVVLNEVLAHTDPPQEDAVELRNLTTNTISLAGWYLSDDTVVRKKYRFPEGTVIAPLGYRVVYQSQLLSGLVPFSLSAKGEGLYLSEANASDQLVRFVDQLQYEASQNGFSFGRFPDGTGPFITLSSPTFGVSAPATVEEFRTGTGARNAGPKSGPVIINEVMYHPADSNALNRLACEYVELLNISSQPVPLYNLKEPTNTWTLTGGISYTFPTNLTLLPGQFALVLSTNEVETFRQSYGLSTNLLILGPWLKALNNAGDTVRLRAPNTVEEDGTLGRFVVDEVTYQDQLPWPLAADGLGGALERTDPLAYGNTAANWHALPDTGTPGTTNSAYLPPGSVIISEIMAVNRSTLRDEEGEYSDWIELCNTTGHTVSLKGWHLTDQADVPTLWTFPDVSIPPYGQLIVFASQKNRSDPNNTLHTNFSLDSNGEYLALFRNDLTLESAFAPAFPLQAADVSYGVDALGTRVETPVSFGTQGRYLVPTNATQLAANWNTPAFLDSAWTPAGNGVGYDTDPDYRPLFQTDLYSEMYGKQGSAFIRYPFSLQESASIDQMTLRVKFDDGFVAWLNGTLVASNNAPALPVWNSRAPTTRSESLAIEFLNVDLSAFSHLLLEGTNVLALQALNSSSTSSDLLLMSELSLSSTPTTTVVSQVIGYLNTATPGSGNSSAFAAVAQPPLLSHPGGLFTGSLLLSITSPQPDAVLRYTLDGSEPTAASPLYSAPLSITGPLEVRARAFVTNQVPSPVVGAVFRRSFLGINEVMASNAISTPEIADFTDFGDWLELYNDSDAAVDLSGYHLSDNLDQPFRWRIPAGAVIPAKGFLLVWADGYDSQPGLTLTRPFWPNTSFVTRAYHANFKLSADGEQVGLFTPSGSLIDGVSFGLQQTDISYGRLTDGGTQWGYFGESTAGTTNRAPQLDSNLHRAPVVRVSPAEPLFVDGPTSVTLSSGAGVSALRYTLDGSQPTSASLLYTNAFLVTTTTVVRARAFAAGLHPGPVATRTFLVNQRKPDLPVVSLVVDPLLFFDNVTGIFKNSLKEREVPVSVQFSPSPSNTAFQVDAGLRLFSYNTFLGAQKPFTIYLDGKYGTSELGYHLFPEKPLGLFDRFVFRNGCDDWNDAFFRDSLCVKLMENQIDCGLQAYRPAVAFLNGAYYGLLELREKLDEMFAALNDKIPLDQVDFYEMDGVGTGADPILAYGSEETWLGLTAFLSTHSLSDPTNYAHVCSQVDIGNLIDYVSAGSFVDDTSWFQNRKWWRDRRPGGRWRWGFFDFDRALLGGNENENQLADMATNMEVFHELLQNAEFRQLFAQRFAAHMNSTFHPSRVIPIIDREAARIRSEMPYYVARYASQSGIASMAAWEAEVEEIKAFARARPANALQHLATLMGSSGTASIQATTPGGGRLLANRISLINGLTNALLADVPVTLTAQPDIGQTFAYWTITSNAVASLFPAGSTWRYQVVTNEVAGWNQPTFDDAAWASGAGQLGYGDGDEATVIGASSNLITCALFRRAFTVANAAAVSALNLQLLRDDGVIVYLNGTEILRSNMPEGAVTPATLASSNITGTSSPNENAYLPFTLHNAALVEGVNVLAVELHQSSVNYSDLGFDMAASLSYAFGTTETNTSASLTFTPSAATGLSIQAFFLPSGESLLPSTITGTFTLTAAGSPWLATGDVYVPSNACLAVQSGVTLQMPGSASLYVQGEVRMEGTPLSPVRIEPNTNDNARARQYLDPALAQAGSLEPRWGGIAFLHADHTGILSNVVLRGASLAAADPVNMKAAISALGSDLLLRGLDIAEVQLPIFVQEGQSIILENSRLFIASIGDAINIKRARYARVEQCEMFSASTTVDTDAIDYDGIQGGIIRGNYLHDFMGDNNDAIDIGEGTLDLLVENNRIERCFDKAVSIGQASTAIVRRNIIQAVDMGLGIKDTGSYGLIEHNTFRDVSHAVAVYEKNPGSGGGAATVRNCLVSHATAESFTCDALSSLQVSYTLSDTELVPGMGNLFAEPQFLRPSQDNFALQTGSAAVDAGDPATPRDPDGSRADMGALPFDWREGHLVISEIHYHPAVAGEPELVDLYNPGGAALDLTGYSFSQGLTYAFPPGALLNPGTRLVLASGPGIVGATLWSAGALDNAGETIELLDASSNEIDRVTFSPFAPWPAAADGQGPSLALLHPKWDNALPSSWRASLLPGGSPGAEERTAYDTPVWWLAQWGATNNFDAAAAADWDLDGVSNWSEYVAGTQPTNASSLFLVQIASSGDSTVVACATVPTGIEEGGKQRYYSLLSRTNLVTGSWQAIDGYTDILGLGQTIVYTNQPAVATGFIRANTELR